MCWLSLSVTYLNTTHTYHECMAVVDVSITGTRDTLPYGQRNVLETLIHLPVVDVVVFKYTWSMTEPLQCVGILIFWVAWYFELRPFGGMSFISVLLRLWCYLVVLTNIFLSISFGQCKWNCEDINYILSNVDLWTGTDFLKVFHSLFS